MPAFAAHYLFALSVRDKIIGYDRTLTLDDAAFAFGAQGPDVLFCHKLWRTVWGGKNLGSLGSALHRCHPSALFAAMKEYLARAGTDTDLLKSYIYGFLCHYSLDRFTHPVICAVQKRVTDEGGFGKCAPFSIHALVETNIDAEMLNRGGFEDGRRFKAHEKISCGRREKKAFSALMAYASAKTVNTDARENDFFTAYSHMQLVERLLYDPAGIKYKLLRVLGSGIRKKTGPVITAMFRPEKNDGKWDYLNLSHTVYPMPADGTRTVSASFFDSLSLASEDALRLVEAFNAPDARAAIREISGDMTFDTGLPPRE